MTVTLSNHPTTELYSTVDLNLAAYLVALGYPLLNLTPSAGDARRRVFTFPLDAGQHVPGYYTGAMVPARAYSSAIRDLKALLFRC